jgi:hypothetical protein
MSKNDYDDDGDILNLLPGKEDIEDWKPTPIHSTKFDSDYPVWVLDMSGMDVCTAPLGHLGTGKELHCC